MSEIYQELISYHKFFAALAIIATFIYVVLINFKIDKSVIIDENKANRDGKKFVKRIRLYLPFYYTLLACVCLTGCVIMPVLQFELKFSVYVMIVFFIITIGLSAMLYKRLKIGYINQNFAKYKNQGNLFLAIILSMFFVASVL